MGWSTRVLPGGISGRSARLDAGGQVGQGLAQGVQQQFVVGRFFETGALARRGGGDFADADAERGELTPPAVGQGGQGLGGGGVDGFRGGECRRLRWRRVVDHDDPVFPEAQGGRDGLDAVQGALDVDLHGQVELLVADLQGRQAQRAVDAVDEAVNAPEFSCTCWASASACPGAAMSAVIASIRSAWNCSAICFASASIRKTRRRATATTVAPSCSASRRAAAYPTPLDAPVTTMTRPSSALRELSIIVLAFEVASVGLSAEPCGLSRLFGYNNAKTLPACGLV